MSSKVSNLFPPVGGATGALLEAFPHFSSILSTIVLAAIGATVGYLVKLLLDWVFKVKRHEEK